MKSPYPCFDPRRIQLKPLAERVNDLRGDFVLPLVRPVGAVPPALESVAHTMRAGAAAGRNTVFMCGGHVLRSGVQRYLINLMERGLLHGAAVNGSVAIHDFEIALQGATTESVARYIQEGQFGLWEETGHINDVVRLGVDAGLGFGEALGKHIAEGAYPFKEQSIFARAWQLGIPVTVHVGIGYDIIHAHPSFDGAATGAACHRDFLIFAHLLETLGCVCCFGSAVMAPEVFLKALSMVRNAARCEGRTLQPFTSLVCDLLDIPQCAMQEAPKNDPRYYFRPWKTLLARTVAGGGESYYVRGHHAQTIPCLWDAVVYSR